MEFKPSRIIWHHTGDSSRLPQFDKIDRYHKSRGFPISSKGSYVGYHTLIEPDGSIRHARKWNEIGAHDQGENLDSLGLGLSGNFNLQLPGKAQTIAAAQELGRMLTYLNVSITRIEPHRRDDTNDCPGKLLADNWLLRQYLAQQPDWIVRLFGWIGEHKKLL